MPSFADYATAAQAREVMERLVQNSIDKERPRIAYATVNSIDRPNRKCQVIYPGDAVAVRVSMGVIQPASVGQVVRIDGPPGDRYISDVMGDAHVVASTSGTTTGGNLTVQGWLKVINNQGGTMLYAGGGGAVDILGYLDFHNFAFADEATDFNMRLYNPSNGRLRLVHKDGADWGGFSAGTAQMNSYGWGNQWANFGHRDKLDQDDGSYGFMQENTGRIIVNCEAGTELGLYRNGGGPKAWLGEGGNDDWCLKHVLLANRDSAVRDDIISLGGWGDYLIGVRSGTLFLNTWDWISSDSRGGGATRTFDWHPDEGCHLRRGWWRCHADSGAGGLYIQYDVWGIKGDGDYVGRSENDEQRLVMRKNSQGGYGTAALESQGGGGSVPYVSFHAAGERASAIRKDNGWWNGVWVNQDAGCADFFANAHPTCSDEARKTDIHVLEGLGLKTIRGLVPKTYKYTPSTEAEIWNTMKHRDERAAGKWRYQVPVRGMVEPWDQEYVGYMAEEIYNRFPLAAPLDPVDNRPWAIDYGRLVVAVISAVNELADRVEDLEGRLARAA